MKRKQRIMAFILTLMMILPSITSILPDSLTFSFGEGKVVNFDLRGLKEVQNPLITGASAANPNYHGAGGSSGSILGSYRGSGALGIGGAPEAYGTQARGYELALLEIPYNEWQKGIDKWPESTWAVTFFAMDAERNAAKNLTAANYKYRFTKNEGDYFSGSRSMFSVGSISNGQFTSNKSDTPGTGKPATKVIYDKFADGLYNSYYTGNGSTGWETAFSGVLDVPGISGSGAVSPEAMVTKLKNYFGDFGTTEYPLNAESLGLYSATGKRTTSSIFTKATLFGDIGVMKDVTTTAPAGTTPPIWLAANSSMATMSGIYVYLICMYELYGASTQLNDIAKGVWQWYHTELYEGTEATSPTNNAYFLMIKPMTYVTVTRTNDLACGDFWACFRIAIQTTGISSDAIQPSALDSMTFRDKIDPTKTLFETFAARLRPYMVTGSPTGYIASTEMFSKPVENARLGSNIRSPVFYWALTMTPTMNRVSHNPPLGTTLDYSIGGNSATLKLVLDNPQAASLWYFRKEDGRNGRMIKTDKGKVKLWDNQFEEPTSLPSFENALYGFNIIDNIMPIVPEAAPIACVGAPELPEVGKHKLEVTIDPGKLDYGEEEAKATVSVNLDMQTPENLQVLAENVWRMLSWKVNTNNGATPKGLTSGASKQVLKPALDWRVYAVHAETQSGTALTNGNKTLSSPKKRRGAVYGGAQTSGNTSTWADITKWGAPGNEPPESDTNPPKVEETSTNENVVIEKFKELVDTGEMFKAEWNGTGPVRVTVPGSEDKVTLWDFSCVGPDGQAGYWREINGKYLVEDLASSYPRWNEYGTLDYWRSVKKAIGFKGVDISSSYGTYTPGTSLGSSLDVHTALKYLFAALSSEGSSGYRGSTVYIGFDRVEGVGPVMTETLAVTDAVRGSLEAAYSAQNKGNEFIYSAFRSGWWDTFSNNAVPTTAGGGGANNSQITSYRKDSARLRFADKDAPSGSTGIAIGDDGDIDDLYYGTVKEADKSDIKLSDMYSEKGTYPETTENKDRFRLYYFGVAQDNEKVEVVIRNTTTTTTSTSTTTTTTTSTTTTTTTTERCVFKKS